jgi:hypothetical protein
MAKLEDRLAALATMSPAQLRLMWDEVVKTPVPALTTDLLRRAMAYRLQEKRHGGLAVMVARELARVAGAASAGVTGSVRPSAAPLRPGTRLVREWQGRTISVVVADDGFVWEERPYRSLTSIAREVTGARWSGPRFFGLTSDA